jgi:hypothetical protein
MRPNVRAKGGANGVTPGPGDRKCTPYLAASPGGTPLALPLSEGLGRTARTPGWPSATENLPDFFPAAEKRGEGAIGLGASSLRRRCGARASR